MDYLLMGAAVCVIIALIVWYIKYFNKQNQKNSRQKNMIIMGCPHCYPHCEPGLKRICPVCHKTVEQDQSLTARLFNKALGKKHVHVVGCSNCHKPRAE